MRYKIEINLLALKELESKINLEEAVLLDYLFWLCSSPSDDVESMRVENDGKKYTWFDYGFYIRETPILRGKTKATITPKIKKLEGEGFIETFQCETTQRKYIKLLPKADGLFRKLNAPVQKTKRPPFRKLNIDKETTIDNKTMDNTAILRIAEKKKIDSFIEAFRPVNPMVDRLFANKTQRGALERLTAKLGEEELRRIVSILPALTGERYAPVITTPAQLEAKLGQLAAFIKKSRTKQPIIGIVN